jgi:tetratricopeptide (TPR) repeat protein
MARYHRLCGRPRRAYELLDHLLLAKPFKEAAWRELAALLPLADVQLAYWIGLRSRGARRIDVMAAALRTAVALRCEPNWIMEILPSDDWPAPLVEQYWGCVETLLTPSEIAAVANGALRLGRRDEAEHLLRRALALAPSDTAASLALIVILEAGSRLIEAEQLAAKAVRLAPENIEASFTLARIQFNLARFKEAAETLEGLLAREPNNPHIWLEYGRLARNSYERVGSEESVFERAGELAGNDAFVLETVAQYFLFQLDYARAAKYYARLFAVAPSAKDNPVACRNYAESLIGSDRKSEAGPIIDMGIERCRAVAAQSSGEGREMIVREEARLLNVAGKTEEATATLRSIKSAAGEYNYSRGEYLGDSPTRLARLRRMVESRDLLILLQGPSFADFATAGSQIADRDFVAATLGAFPPVEDVLLKTTGRYVDLVLLSHPTRLRSWSGEFLQFLMRPKRNMLLTSRYAMTALSDLGISEADFVRQHDERLLYVQPVEGPPLPSRPLHFESGGSLALMLPLLLLGRPRRVFVFGADGGASPGAAKRAYCYYDDFDSGGLEQDFVTRPDIIDFRRYPEWLTEANRRFRIDAVNNDRIITFALQSLETIFDVPIPPIFNVCPHSTHAIFPKIDCQTAMKMLQNKAS